MEEKEEKKQTPTKKLAEEKKTSSSEEDFGISLEEMFNRGVAFGHKTSRFHPGMKPYIYGLRNTIHILDLEKTAEKFREALKFIQGLISEDKTLLLVGTKIQTKDLVKEVAEECDLPYINGRWLGGTFTNFETIRKRIEYYKDLEKKKAEGGLDKYSKKERAKIEDELQGLKTKFEGIRNIKKLPEAIFVLDMKKDNLAIKEARKKGVEVIAIADTNVDPNLADYPIPANDDAISSVRYILEKAREVILKSKLKTQSAKPQLKTKS